MKDLMRGKHKFTVMAGGEQDKETMKEASSKQEKTENLRLITETG